MSTWKPALKKLTKSEKSQAAELREEINFLENIPRLHPHLLELWGETYWMAKYAIALKSYESLYPGRDLKDIVKSLDDS